jgi:hypothetical protein
MAGRWSLIINNAADKVTRDELASLRKINKSLADVANDRNIVVHGQILYDGMRQKPFAIVTRGASAGKFHP